MRSRLRDANGRGRGHGGEKQANSPHEITHAVSSATTRTGNPATMALLQRLVDARPAVSGVAWSVGDDRVRGPRVKRRCVAAHSVTARSLESCLGCRWPATAGEPGIKQDAIYRTFSAPPADNLPVAWLLEPYAHFFSFSCTRTQTRPVRCCATQTIRGANYDKVNASGIDGLICTRGQ